MPKILDNKFFKSADEIDMSHFFDRLKAECNSSALNYDFYFNAIGTVRSSIMMIRYEDVALRYKYYAKVGF